MKKLLSLALAITLSAGFASGQETPKWIRSNSISPDGTKIAFSYKGDIFVVPAAGGREIQEGGVAQTQKAQTRAVCSGGREPAF